MRLNKIKNLSPEPETLKPTPSAEACHTHLQPYPNKPLAMPLTQRILSTHIGRMLAHMSQRVSSKSMYFHNETFLCTAVDGINPAIPDVEI